MATKTSIVKLKQAAIRTYKAAEASEGEFYDKARESGEALCKLKKQMAHGEWLPWLEANGIKERKAQAYMKLARGEAETISEGAGTTRPKSATVADLPDNDVGGYSRYKELHKEAEQLDYSLSGLKSFFVRLDGYIGGIADVLERSIEEGLIEAEDRAWLDEKLEQAIEELQNIRGQL